MTWRDTALTDMLGIELPIVLAPLAGGPSTPALAAAVSNAGGLGSLGLAYLSADRVRAEVRRLRELTDRPFIASVLLQGTPSVDRALVESVWERLAVYRAELDLQSAEPPSRFSESVDEQVAVLVEERVPVAAFAFGMPDAAIVEAFHRQGTRVAVTVATPEEAEIAERGGADLLCAQGIEAGGHRGGFGSDTAGSMTLLTLVPAVRAASRLPVVAAGGIMDGRGIAAVLALGAAGAQLGTAFLRCPEAGTSAPYREALVQPGVSTALITGISGRPARGIWNRLAAELADLAPAVGYPVLNALTRDIRRRAAELGRAEFLSLWAGEGVRAIRDMPAGALVERLAAETDEAVAALR